MTKKDEKRSIREEAKGRDGGTTSNDAVMDNISELSKETTIVPRKKETKT